MKENAKQHYKVLVVDDDAQVLESTVRILQEFDFLAYPFSDGRKASTWLQQEQVDVVLSDIQMPFLTGIQLLDNIRAQGCDTPVILVSGYAELETAISALQKGAFDFILKPFDPLCLVKSLENASRFARLKKLERTYKTELEQTVAQRTMELQIAKDQLDDMSREVIARLAAAAELRDDETGRHNARIGGYAGLIAKQMHLPADFVETITLASTMHDVGKIGIPDSILLKPSSLTPEEFALVQTHTTIGHRLLDGSSHNLLQMAASIAHTHHERWDGSGYPRKLKAEQIPIEGRIVMLADHYDALRTKRSYKSALDHLTTLRIIFEGDGRTHPKHFDPQVLRAFEAIAGDLDKIFTTPDNDNPDTFLPNSEVRR